MNREPPARVKRELRRESNFGCANCGHPIVTYHHIVPWSIEEHHDPDRMIALCRRCHSSADDGAIKEDILYDLKQNPEISDVTSHNFVFRSEIPTIVFGGFQSILREKEEMVLWRIDGEDQATAYFDNGIIEFSGEFYDQSGQLVAEFDRNSWWVDVDAAWDLVAKNKEMKFWHEKRDIGFGMEYRADEDLIVGRGKFHTKEGVVNALPDKTKFPNGTVAGGNIGVDVDCLVNIGESEDSISAAFSFQYN